MRHFYSIMFILAILTMPFGTAFASIEGRGVHFSSETPAQKTATVQSVASQQPIIIINSSVNAINGNTLTEEGAPSKDIYVRSAPTQVAADAVANNLDDADALDDADDEDEEVTFAAVRPIRLGKIVVKTKLVVVRSIETQPIQAIAVAPQVEVAQVDVAGFDPMTTTPDKALESEAQRIKASFYGGPTDRRWNGRHVACSGYFNTNETQHLRRFDDSKYTAASNSLECGTVVKLTNPDTGLTVDNVIITDTGGFSSKKYGSRQMDVSYATAQDLGMVETGVTHLDMVVKTIQI